jgi:hypothetical protein
LRKKTITPEGGGFFLIVDIVECDTSFAPVYIFPVY